MKILALLGEPATGKSTIAKLFVSRLSKGQNFKQGLVFGTTHGKERVFVLGRYDADDKFSGTDKFSMAAQPDAGHFLRSMAFHNPSHNVFFEGDRLGNAKFLEFCKTLGELKIIVLSASAQEKLTRHVKRMDSQSETFLKSRATKISNIKKAFPEAQEFPNDNPKQQSVVLCAIDNFFSTF